MNNFKKLVSIMELANMSDLEFYYQYLQDAPYEELCEFIKEFPDFLEEDAAKAREEFPQEDHDRMLAEIKKKLHIE